MRLELVVLVDLFVHHRLLDSRVDAHDQVARHLAAVAETHLIPQNRDLLVRL